MTDPETAAGWKRRRAPQLVVGALVVAALVVAVQLTGCGVPSEQRAHLIAAEDLPFGLAPPDASAVSLDHSPAIDAVIGIETVSLFFVSGTALVSVPFELRAPVVLSDVVDALAAGPGDVASRYRSAVDPNHVVGATVRAGVAIVELNKSFRELPNAEQRLAVAQLVLSLTSRPGIGQIEFVIGGESVPVPRSDGTLGGGRVSRDDFIELVKADS